MKMIVTFFLFSFGSLFASDVVFELLVSDHDNNFWQTKKPMHLTIGVINDVDLTKLQVAIEEFNKENSCLLQKSVNKGFVVELFNPNGFGKGLSILEADQKTTARFSNINNVLYYFLIEHQFGPLNDKTTPKTINPNGYTPHISFYETNPEKIPVKGDTIHFKDYHLHVILLKNIVD